MRQGIWGRLARREKKMRGRESVRAAQIALQATFEFGNRAGLERNWLRAVKIPLMFVLAMSVSCFYMDTISEAGIPFKHFWATFKQDWLKTNTGKQSLSNHLCWLRIGRQAALHACSELWRAKCYRMANNATCGAGRMPGDVNLEVKKPHAICWSSARGQMFLDITNHTRSWSYPRLKYCEASVVPAAEP